MPTITINLTENVTPAMAQMMAEARGEGFVKSAGEAMADETVNFYRGLEQSRPNRMGWQRQHFWEAVAKSVQRPRVLDATTATISITHVAIRQRIEGGRIRPTGGKKYLTLPANEKAYGHVAREFAFLRFGFAENRYGRLAPALIAAERTEVKLGRKRKDGSRGYAKKVRAEEVFYWLVRQVYQPADPGALPTDAQFTAAAVRGATAHAQALTDRAQKTLNQLKAGGAA